MDKKQKLELYGGNLVSLLPFIVFVSVSLYISLQLAPDTKGMWVGMLTGLIVTFFFAKDKVYYGDVLIRGMASKMAVTPVVCWIWAGVFVAILRSSGLVEGILWVAYKIGAQGTVFVVIAFFASAIFSTATGTGFGTTVAGMSVLYPAGVLLGANPLVLAGAIIGGGAFGDNLAPVSDTTICSAATQDADVIGVVKSRLRYSIVAGIMALVAIFIFGGGGAVGDVPQEMIMQYVNAKGLLMFIPAILTIYLAVKKGDIVYAISIGIVAAIVTALASGLNTMSGLFYIKDGATGGVIINGITDMVDISILTLLIMSGVEVMKAGGGDKKLLEIVKKFAKSVVGVETAIATLELALSGVMGVNTPAILAVGAPFAKPLGDAYKIHPYRRANILDGTACTVNYCVPWAGVVLVASQISGKVNEQFGDLVPVIMPHQFAPWIFYCWALLAVWIFSIATGWGRTFIGPNGEPVKEIPKEQVS